LLADYPGFALSADCGDYAGSYAAACGGYLIHPDIVLTSARSARFDQIHWSVGTTFFISLTQVDGSDAVDRCTVQSKVLNPEFSSPFRRNNLMLVKLSTPSSQPIGILNTDNTNPSVGDPLRIVGFGSREDLDVTGNVVRVFNEATVTRVSDSECETAGWDEFCAGDSTTTICAEDEGGPVFDDGTGVIVGVISDSAAQCQGPGKFMRASYYRNWIETNICNLSDDPPSTCPVCGDGTCSSPNEGPYEDCGSCPQDCGSCFFCGDGFCKQDESYISCPQDCERERSPIPKCNWITVWYRLFYGWIFWLAGVGPICTFF